MNNSLHDIDYDADDIFEDIPMPSMSEEISVCNCPGHFPHFDFTDNRTSEPSNVASDDRFPDDMELFHSIDPEVDVFEKIAFSNENSFLDDELITAVNSSKHPAATKTHSIIKVKRPKLCNIKSTDAQNSINFQGICGLRYEQCQMKLTAPPATYQRARYEKELNNALRYVFVPTDDGALTLEISDHPDQFALHSLCYLQIIRTTVPFGPQKLTLLHPYPLWINNKNASVFNNTLLIPIRGQVVQINCLTMARSKQGDLKNFRDLPIYSPDYLQFIGNHSINLKKKEKIVDVYQLRKSIIHFRICIVDQHNTIFSTNISCATPELHEFEGPKLKDLPEEVRLLHKQWSKRKPIGEGRESSPGPTTTKEFFQPHDFEEYDSLDALLTCS